MRQSILIAALLATFGNAVVAQPSSAPHAELFKILNKISHPQRVFKLNYQAQTSSYILTDNHYPPLSDQEYQELGQLLQTIAQDTAFWNQLGAKETDGYASTTYEVGGVIFHRVRCEESHSMFNWKISFVDQSM